MDIKLLKQMIESKTLTDDLIIFKYKNSDFIPTQYYREIAKLKNLEVKLVESLSEVSSLNNIWDIMPEYLYVYKVDKLNEEIDLSLKNLIIITKNVAIKEIDFVEVPELEDWQIKSYINSVGKGLEEKQVDWLLRTCKKDMFLLDSELDKLKLFNDKEKHIMFDKFYKDGLFNHISDKSIFDICNAICNKDLSKLSLLLKKLDVEPMALVALLYSNFNKLIQVWCTKDPSDYNTSLTNAQIWAIKKQPIKYSYEQLVNAFNVICSMDYKLRNGLIDNDVMIDYMLVNILM